MKIRKREAKRKKKELAHQAAILRAKAEQAKLDRIEKMNESNEKMQNGDSTKEHNGRKPSVNKQRQFTGNKDRKFLKKVGAALIVKLPLNDNS